MATEPAPVGRDRDPLVAVWYRQHGPALRNAVRRGRIGAAGVEDATQDVWLAVLGELPPADVVADPERLTAWLRGAVRRRCLDLLRRERRRRQISLAECAGPKVPLPGDEADHRAVHAVLTAMREGGAEPAARLIELRYLDGLRPATIGEMLGLTARQVSARLQRAKKAFRRAWAHRQGRGGRTQATN